MAERVAWPETIVLKPHRLSGVFVDLRGARPCTPLPNRDGAIFFAPRRAISDSQDGRPKPAPFGGDVHNLSRFVRADELHTWAWMLDKIFHKNILTHRSSWGIVDSIVSSKCDNATKSVRVTPELLKRIKVAAARKSKTIAQIVDAAVRAYLADK